MIIRKSQSDQLATERLLDRIVDILCATYLDARPRLTSGPGRRVLREQYGKANGYGLSSELDVARYIITAWLLGTDFDTRFPAMQETLRDASLSPERKAESIEEFSVTLLETLQAGK
jgi:hypothetical protein